jgi:3-methyladenine DNA glycosylase AlkD
MTLISLRKEIRSLTNPEKAKLLQRFFKTGKGDYGEGDIFLGLVVPQERMLAKKYHDLSLVDCQTLLNSKIHEERMISLFILMTKYKKSEDKIKKDIFNFYISNTRNINNWDLVDLSSPKIVGNYLFDKDRKILYKLAKSQSLWERRISILATFYFIANKQFDDALNIAEILLNDKHDLMHKAVGWMLREIGKRDLEVEEDFLKKHYRSMPRTMLRYAIEKFPEERRKAYLLGTI